MWSPRVALLGFVAQLPFMSSPPAGIPSREMSEFNLKTGKDRFSPKDLIELPRPDTGKANPAGDLVLTYVAKYSFKDKKWVQTSPKFLAFAYFVDL
jgi:hypothetical protein